MAKLDVIIFGAGLSGATAARLLAEQGHKVTIYEQRTHPGGNCYDYLNEHGIMIHKYGPHVFHTQNKQVYDFISKFTKFNTYKHQVLAVVEKQKIVLPLNLASIAALAGKNASLIIKQIIKLAKNKKFISIYDLINATHPGVQTFGQYVYDNIYVNYSTKMWGQSMDKIDHSVLDRIMIHLDKSNNFFPRDKYQGVPIGGYTQMIRNMLKHKNIKVNYGVNGPDILKIKNNRTYLNDTECKKTIFYCGSVDELLENKYGYLLYRSLDIVLETHNVDAYQEVGVINYPADPSMTRITEYKKLSLQHDIRNVTTVSKEYPRAYNPDASTPSHRFYSVKSFETDLIFNKYLTEIKKIKNLHLLGRLAEYSYFDMDDAIANAMAKVAQILINY
ncbi:MAG: UDP-galactopyranose mutase [Mycoplasmataceae bacterium]|jgi:UDP-galactopyranose mutase|nr:UDP-galactopyranose mutase [Mycoplasmataceae bacterium]